MCTSCHASHGSAPPQPAALILSAPVKVPQRMGKVRGSWRRGLRRAGRVQEVTLDGLASQTSLPQRSCVMCPPILSLPRVRVLAVGKGDSCALPQGTGLSLSLLGNGWPAADPAAQVLA